MPRAMSVKPLIFYLQEEYIHELRYNTYVTDMLRSNIAINVGKDADLPPRYIEMVEQYRDKNKEKLKLTKDMVKDRFLRLIK